MSSCVWRKPARSFLQLWLCAVLPLCCLFAIAGQCSAASAPASSGSHDVSGQRGTASWYGKTATGKRTASGTIFNKEAFTAAHRTLPFGTVVRVYSLRTNKHVLVTIADRGPYKKSRLIDISSRAAEALDIQHHGVVQVAIEVVAQPNSRPLVKGHGFFVQLATAAHDQGAHVLGATLEKKLGQEIRALHTTKPSGYVLCLGPYGTFRQAENAAHAIAPKHRAMAIIEAPVDKGVVPAYIAP